MGLKEVFDKKNRERDIIEYSRSLEKKLPSFDAWIEKREASLPKFDMSVSTDTKRYGAPEDLFRTPLCEYITRIDHVTFHIVPMEKIRDGFSIRKFIEDIIIFVNGELSESALYLIAQKFMEFPDCSIVYGDEDIAQKEDSAEMVYGKIKKGSRRNPYFKPDWSPHAFLSHFYFCNIVAIKRAGFKDIGWTGELTGARSLYHNLLRYIYKDLKTAETAVRHIDEILIHASDYDNNRITDDKAETFAKKCRNKITSSQKITTVIQTKGLTCEMAEDVSCRAAALAKQFGYDIEVLCTEYAINTAEFNEICNKANGDTLFLLNANLISDAFGRAGQLLDALDYAFTGAVSCRIVSKDNKIVSAGIFNNAIYPVHKLSGTDMCNALADTAKAYKDNETENSEDSVTGDFLKYSVNVTALTSLCMMISKNAFERVGGFNVKLPATLSEFEFGLKLNNAGYRNVSMNNLSVTADFPYTETNLPAPVLDEALNPFSDVRDSFYNKYLVYDCYDVRMVPGAMYSVSNYDLAPLHTQLNVPSYNIHVSADVVFKTEYIGNSGKFSRDFESLIIEGYSLLKGDDNAFYERTLLFEVDGNGYMYKYDGVFRSDVSVLFNQEKHVGLSGILVVTDAILYEAIRNANFVTLQNCFIHRGTKDVKASEPIRIK